MANITHSPAIPYHAAGLSGVRGIAGHIAAALFVLVVGLVSVEVIKFQPAAAAECVADICGAGAN